MIKHKITTMKIVMLTLLIFSILYLNISIFSSQFEYFDSNINYDAIINGIEDVFNGKHVFSDFKQKTNQPNFDPIAFNTLLTIRKQTNKPITNADIDKILQINTKADTKIEKFDSNSNTITQTSSQSAAESSGPSDASSCVESMKLITDMIQKNQDDYKAKLDDWQNKKAALQQEYTLGTANYQKLIGGTGGTLTDMLWCEGEDNYITHLGWRSGDNLDRIEISCKNGEQYTLGGYGGTPNANPDCPGGFTSFKVGGDIGNIKRVAGYCPSTLYWARQEDKTRDYGVGNPNYNTYEWGCVGGDGYNCLTNNGTNSTGEFTCPRGTVLKGMFGRKGDRIDAIGFKCAPPGYISGFKTFEEYALAKLGPKPQIIPVQMNGFLCKDCRQYQSKNEVTDSTQVNLTQINNCIEDLKTKDDNIGNKNNNNASQPPSTQTSNTSANTSTSASSENNDKALIVTGFGILILMFILLTAVLVFKK